MSDGAEQRPAVVVQVGSLRLSGPWALAIVAALVGVIVALVVWAQPPRRVVATLLIWLAFQIYWTLAARRSSKAVSSESPGSRAIHTRLLNLSMLLLLISWPGLRTRFVPLTDTVVAIGFAVQALGFALAAWARVCLGRNWSGNVRVAADHELIRSGPYRWVRHPIYTAMFLMYAGSGLVYGELHALVAFAVLVFAYARKIPQEERLLRETFGPAYEAYQRESAAVVPYLF